MAAVRIEACRRSVVGWAARRFQSLSPAARSFMQLLTEDLRATARKGVRVLEPR